MADYNLEQIKLGIMLATVRFLVFWAAVPKQCSVNRRKGDQSSGVDLHELLCYRPINDLHEDWLDHITELVSAVGGPPAPSLLLPHPPLATVT